MKNLTLTAAVAALFTGAFGQNLVQNPGFETGSVTPQWTIVFASAFFAVSNFNAHTGTFALQYGSTDPNNQDEIRQTIATMAGASYIVSFWGFQNGGREEDSNMKVSFGGVAVLNGQLTDAYAQYSAVIVASGTSTVLDVKGYNIPAFAYTDDFSVTPVPEPATILAISTALALLVSRRRRVALIRVRTVWHGQASSTFKYPQSSLACPCSPAATKTQPPKIPRFFAS